MKRKILWFAICTLLTAAVEVNAQVRPPIFEEDFESVPLGGIPDGWDNDSIKGGTKWSPIRGGYDKSISMVYDNQTSLSEQFGVLMTPEIEVTEGLTVSFNLKLSESIGFILYASYDGGKTFDMANPIYELSEPTSDWVRVMERLPESATGKITLCFYAYKMAWKVCSAMIDNVVVDYEPRCAGVETIRTIGLTSTTANLTWTCSDMGMIPSTVEVLLTKEGETVRNYTEETEGRMSITIENLDKGAKYGVKLRMDCSASYSGKSEWSDEYTFRTPCDPVGLPINYQFDDLTDVPSCWTTEGGTGIELSEDMGMDNGKALKVAGASGTVFIYTEQITHAANDMQISFWAYNDDEYGYDHEIAVGLQSDITQASTYSELAKITLAGGVWQRVVLPTTESLLGTTEGVYVVLSATDFEPYYSNSEANWYIDNFTVTEIPDCILPEAVTMTSMNSTEIGLEWKGDADLDVYNVRSAGDTILLSTVKKTDGKLTGLTAGTEYMLMFKSRCSETSASEWGVDSIRVRTEAAIVESAASDFESGIPESWLHQGTYGTLWEVTEEQYHSGVQGLKLPARSGTASLILPPVNVTEAGYTLKLWVYRTAQSSYSGPSISVYASPTQERGADALLLGKVNAMMTAEPAVQKDGWYEYDFDMTQTGKTFVIIEGTANFMIPMYIDDVSLDVSPMCKKPTGITLAEGEITDEAKVTWTPGTTETEWEITYTYGGLETPVTDKVSGTPKYTIEGLEENTGYDVEFTVKALCDGGETSEGATGYLSFRTECAPIDVINGIYTEDFTTKTMYCWTVLQSDGGYDAPSITETQGYSFRGNAIVAMPEFNYTSLKGYKLTFLYEGCEDSEMEVGIITDLNFPEETFQTIKSIPGPTENNNQTVTFENYDGTGRIAFRYTSTAFIAFDNSYLNRVRLIPANPDCPDTEIETGEITHESAAITAIGGAADKFDYEYGLARFTPGEGTLLEDQPANVTLTGLSPDTEYDVYARSICEDGEGTWSDYVRFRTKCAAVDVTEEDPFTEGFEAGALGCWTAVQELAMANAWMIGYGDGYNQSAHTGDYFVKLGGSYDEARESDLYYPVNLTAGEQYEFECYYSASEKTTLSIALCNGVGDDAPEIIRTVQLTPQDMGGQGRPSQYQRMNFVFLPLNTASYIRLKGTVGDGMTGVYGIYVDDIRISPIECEYPDSSTLNFTQLTDVSALMEWSDVGAESYNVKISTKEIDPNSETADIYNGASNGGNSHNATGLSEATQYYVYVQSVCGETSSAWVGPFMLETMCAETDLASEDFEDEDVLECWRHEGGTVSESSDTAYSGEASVLFAGDGVTRLMSPTISVSPLSKYMVTLRAYTESYATVTIGVVPDASEPGNYLPIASDIQVSYQEGWKEVSAYLDILGEEGLETYAASKNIVIIAEGQVYIDDVSLQPIPECRKPQNVSISTLTGDEVTFTWTAASGDTYRAVLKQGEETVKEITENVVSPLTIDGLTPAESYTLEMTSICTGGNESEAMTVEFTTQAVYSFPYYNNFDGSAVGKELPEYWTNVVKEGDNANGPENLWGVGVHEDNGTAALTYQCTSNANNGTTTSIVQSPIINLTDTEEATLSFSYCTPTRIDVLLSTDGGETFDVELGKNLMTEYSSETYTYVWDERSFDISQYCGQEVVIGIRAYGKEQFCDVDIFIDDFSVAPDNGCAVPDGLKATAVAAIEGTVELSVKSVPTEQWQAVIGEPGFDPNEEGMDTLTFSEMSNVVSQLPLGTYDVYTRSVCGNDIYSVWNGPVTFTTLGAVELPCEAVSLPYTDNFDSGEPQCWWNLGTSAEYPWTYHTEAGGNGVMKFNSQDNQRNVIDILYSPLINVTEAGYSVSMDYINPAGGPMSIYLSTNKGATYSDTLVEKATGANQWQTASFSLDKYVGEEVLLAIKGTSNYSLKDGAYIYVDNFRVTQTITKAVTDTVCYEEDYERNGFMLPSGTLSYGENKLSRMAVGRENEPDTLYEVTVYVPNTDYYVEDTYIAGEEYNGYGFAGVTGGQSEYVRTEQSSCGCDSTIHLILTERMLSEEIYDSICEGDTYEFCGEEKNASGTYTCEETVEGDRTFTTTLHLTVLPVVIERKDTVCEADLPYIFGEQSLIETGVYEKDSTYANGCGCTVRLDLLVVKLEERIDTVICQGSYVEIDGVRYSTEGEHHIQQPMLGGCGRTLILDIKLTPADTVTYYTVACEGKPIYDPGFAGTMVNSDTVLYRTDKTAGGCDSVTKLVAEYHETVQVYDTVNTADNVYRYDGQDLVTSGDYTSKGLTADGCDSIHHLHLTFTTGIDGAEVLNLVIAPNPTRTGITAYAEGPWTEADVEEGLTLEILDAAGRRIRTEEVKRVPIAIDGLNVSGMYIVRITSKDGTAYTGRLIVK